MEIAEAALCFYVSVLRPDMTTVSTPPGTNHLDQNLAFVRKRHFTVIESCALLNILSTYQELE